MMPNYVAIMFFDSGTKCNRKSVIILMTRLSSFYTCYWIPNTFNIK